MGRRAVLGTGLAGTAAAALAVAAPAAAAAGVVIAHATAGSTVSFRVLPAGSRCSVTGPTGATVRSWTSGTGFVGADTRLSPAGSYTVRVAGSGVTCPFRLPLGTGSFDPAPPAPTVPTGVTVDRGAWTAGTTYAVGDLVTAGGRHWRATASSSGEAPAATPSRWAAR